MYWSNIRVSWFTLQNWPRTKYTPFWIWNDDPVIAASLATVRANGAPEAIAVLPNNPEVIISEHVNSSPSENTWVALFDVLDVR